MRSVYCIFFYLIVFVVFYFGELDILWVGFDGGLLNCVVFYIIDGDGVVIIGQGQQIFIIL